MDRKRAFKLRFRRQLRLQKRQVEAISATAEKRLEDDFFKRLERLVVVRRFVGSWILLVVLLIGCVVAQTRALNGYYQQLRPAPGGTYTEGVIGSFTNANPIYASDIVNSSVSKLLFAGLLSYDANNQLTTDLASAWSVDDTGTVYTVHLRPNLTWQDGQPLTAADVLFTYQVIQNPDANSPLYASWQGITVSATDPHTVTFTLPNPLASFPHSLTTGIIPRHILGSTAMADMRSSAFNSTHPIGAGPFQWQGIQLTGGSSDTRQERVALRPFANYHAGKPKLSGFVVRTFRTSKELVASFQKQEVSAVVGLTSVPKSLKNDRSAQIYNIPLTAQVMTFFKGTEGVLSDLKVRQALVQGADTNSIIASLPYPTRAVREPLLQSQVGYNAIYQQPGYNPTAAGALLDSAGWPLGRDGLRHNGSATLTFELSVQNSGEYPAVARQLVKQWRALGVNAQLIVTPDDATFQNILANHTYDAVLFGISVGVDPDVYVYWDSSQANPLAPMRLNLSEYKSATADASLEAGRTRLDPALRSVKYQTFLQAWQQDAPALGLYQPRFLYITRGPVYGLDRQAVNTDSDRFDNVQNWEIREERQTD